jgi:GT2 family glycosyltransferase
MMPRLSVVIPSHHRADLLRACLASVCRYAPSGTEVLVVDDGSPGGVVSQAARLFSQANILRLPRRRGFCAAANAGIRAASGAIVELLNDDTEVTANWATAALAAFADPTVAAVAPLVLDRCREGRIDSSGDRYYVGGVAGKRGHGQALTAAYLEPCRVFGASASSAFYRRAALMEVGGFDESFGAYFEDVDLSFRLNRAGYQIRYEPAARVYHHGGSSYGTRQRSLLEQQSRNEERVFWRHMPARALPRHLAVLAGKAWRRWSEGTLTPFLCGRLRVLGDIPALLRQRRGPGPNKIRDWCVEDRFWTE